MPSKAHSCRAGLMPSTAFSQSDVTPMTKQMLEQTRHDVVEAKRKTAKSKQYKASHLLVAVRLDAIRVNFTVLNHHDALLSIAVNSAS